MLLIYETQVHAPNPGAGYSSVFTWKSWNRSIFFHDVVSHRICLVLCLLVSVSPYFSFDYLAIFCSLSLTPLPHTLLFSASLHPTPEFFSSHPASFVLSFCTTQYGPSGPTRDECQPGNLPSMRTSLCVFRKISMRMNMIVSALLIEAPSCHLGSGVQGQSEDTQTMKDLTRTFGNKLFPSRLGWS